MTLARNRTHWRQGYKAYVDGVALLDNPYNWEEQPPEHSLWHEGWRIAEEDDLHIPSMLEIDDDD